MNERVDEWVSKWIVTYNNSQEFDIIIFLFIRKFIIIIIINIYFVDVDIIILLDNFDYLTLTFNNIVRLITTRQFY